MILIFDLSSYCFKKIKDQDQRSWPGILLQVISEQAVVGLPSKTPKTFELAYSDRAYVTL